LTALLGCYCATLPYFAYIFYLRGLLIYLEERGTFLFKFLLVGLLAIRVCEEFRFIFLLLFDFCRLLLERERLRDPLTSGDLALSWFLLAPGGDLFLILSLLVLGCSFFPCLGSTFFDFCKLWLRLLLLFNLSSFAFTLCLLFLIMLNKINYSQISSILG